MLAVGLSNGALDRSYANSRRARTNWDTHHGGRSRIRMRKLEQFNAERIWIGIEQPSASLHHQAQQWGGIELLARGGIGCRLTHGGSSQYWDDLARCVRMQIDRARIPTEQLRSHPQDDFSRLFRATSRAQALA